MSRSGVRCPGSPHRGVSLGKALTPNIVSVAVTTGWMEWNVSCWWADGAEYGISCHQCVMTCSVKALSDPKTRNIQVQSIYHSLIQRGRRSANKGASRQMVVSVRVLGYRGSKITSETKKICSVAWWPWRHIWTFWGIKSHLRNWRKTNISESVWGVIHHISPEQTLFVELSRASAACWTDRWKCHQSPLSRR